MNVFVSAGDPSGDLYGSLLLRELRRASPGLRADAVGGPLMRAELGSSGDFLCDLASLGVTGFFEPIRRVPMLIGLLARIRRALERGRHDKVVVIDYYGFHRRVLEVALKAGRPAYYFVSPQVWASRPGRVRTLKRLVRRMLVIFPFEEDIYRGAGVPVTWVGHPLLDLLPEPDLSRRLDPARLRIGLLPGSRPGEVRRHLPLMLEAARRLRERSPGAEVSVFAAPQMPDPAYALPAWVRLVRESDYAERARQDLVLTSSGTATLENALLGLPMVVVYKLAWPTYLLARALIRVRHIAMANILAGQALVPELIQRDAEPSRVAEAALELVSDPERWRSLRARLAGLRARLGGPGAVARAAEAILA